MKKIEAAPVADGELLRLFLVGLGVPSCARFPVPSGVRR
jgi:hypothetical protein